MLSIRTQDRMSLVPYDRPIIIRISPTEEQINIAKKEVGLHNGAKKLEEISSYILMHKKITLGTYATKERALEVLGEIEEHANGKILISQSPQIDKDKMTYTYVYNGFIDVKNIQIVPTVYQMPKE